MTGMVTKDLDRQRRRGRIKIKTFDNEKLIYLSMPEKKSIYDSILLKVGEAF